VAGLAGKKMAQSIPPGAVSRAAGTARVVVHYSFEFSPKTGGRPILAENFRWFRGFGRHPLPSSQRKRGSSAFTSGAESLAPSFSWDDVQAGAYGSGMPRP